MDGIRRELQAEPGRGGCTDSAAASRPPEQAGGSPRCDVAIVGYGPVGMITAAVLAHEGLRVIVIERFPERYKLPRAGHLDGETMRGAFQRLGIAEEVELISRPMVSHELVTPEAEVLASVRLGEGGSGWKNSYLFYQPELEEIVDRRARELGVVVMMNTTALRIDQDANGVDVMVRETSDEGATPQAIRASFLLGADGANSFVRDRIGVAKQDLGFPPIANLVVDIAHDDPDRDLPAMGENRQILDVTRPTLVGRWAGGRWSRVEFRMFDGDAAEYLADEAKIWALLAPYGLDPSMGRIDRSAVHVFESSTASDWRRGRVFLIGDAAHTMPPFMGQGMCSGIRDGLNLAWKLKAVIRGQASPALLETYETERAPHVLQLIRMAMRLGEQIQVSDPAAGRRRDDELRAGRGEAAPPFPRLGAGIVRNMPDGDDDPALGSPALQARVAAGRRVDRLDAIVAPGWRLLIRHKLPDGLLNDQQRDTIAKLDLATVHITRGAGDDRLIDIDAEYDLWFRQLNSKAVLIRPDNYIFGTARDIADVPSLIDDLRQALQQYGREQETIN